MTDLDKSRVPLQDKFDVIKEIMARDIMKTFPAKIVYTPEEVTVFTVTKCKDLSRELKEFSSMLREGINLYGKK